MTERCPDVYEQAPVDLGITLGVGLGVGLGTGLGVGKWDNCSSRSVGSRYRFREIDNVEAIVA